MLEAMYLTKHLENGEPRWALDDALLSAGFSLGDLLQNSAERIREMLREQESGDKPSGRLIAPIERMQEVWASGVTYIRSREARMAESGSKDVYRDVYEAERPELFFKAIGWRVVGTGEAVRIRRDSRWNVPEPELTLVINAGGEVVGYTAGNDMSSRDIEGANPLYLPQAKVYDGSCSVGPGIVIAEPDEMRDLTIHLTVLREGGEIYSEAIQTSRMKRGLEELASYLCRELVFPQGVFLMTGTGIVPDDGFTLLPGDEVRVRVGDITLQNQVSRS